MHLNLPVQGRLHPFPRNRHRLVAVQFLLPAHAVAALAATLSPAFVVVVLAAKLLPVLHLFPPALLQVRFVWISVCSFPLLLFAAVRWCIVSAQRLSKQEHGQPY